MLTKRDKGRNGSRAPSGHLMVAALPQPEATGLTLTSVFSRVPRDSHWMSVPIIAGCCTACHMARCCCCNWYVSVSVRVRAVCIWYTESVWMWVCWPCVLESKVLQSLCYSTIRYAAPDKLPAEYW